jgi:uncharacterized protein (TIGR03437 family)
MVFSSKAISTTVLFLTFSSVLCATPRLGLSTTTIGPINIATGSNGPGQTVQAYNYGDGSLTLTATSSASWLTASVGSQTACVQASGGCYPISLSLNTSGLAGGAYTEYLTISSTGAIDSPQTIAVTVNTAPVPSSITAYVTPNGGSFSTTTFPVFTGGTGVKGTVTTQGGNWLQFLSGSSGIVAASSPWLIQVAAQNGMAPGTYTGSVAIAGSSVASDNKTINVTLNVTSAPIVSVNNTTIQLAGYAGGPAQYAVVNFSNLTSGTTLTVATASSSAAFLTASVSSPGTLLLTATPGSLAPGLYTSTVTITSNAANNALVAIPVEFTVAPAGLPSISMGGIVNAATGAQEAVSQGDIASIYGTQFAALGTSAVNSSTPLATTLGSTQVLLNNVPVPLYYVSPGQINFQVPYGAPANQLASVQVVANGNAGNLRSLSVNASAPRLLYFVSFIAGNYGVIVNAGDGSLTLPSGTTVPGFATHPAKPGDTIVIYGIGFGQTTPAAVEGAAAPSKAPLESIGNVTATFGGGFGGIPVAVTPSFSGLTPTAVGLYQVNVVVPPTPPFGNAVPITLSVGGVQTNSVYLAISTTGK